MSVQKSEVIKEMPRPPQVLVILCFLASITEMKTRNPMKHNWDVEKLIEHVTFLLQILVAELAVHKRLETTRHYILPSEEDRGTAMEGLRIDYSWGTWRKVPHSARCRRCGKGA